MLESSGFLLALRKRKTVYLAHPSTAQCLQKQDREGTFFEERPALGQGVNFVKIVLEPGDALFIPKCWIHAITSEEEAVGLSIKVTSTDEVTQKCVYNPRPKRVKTGDVIDLDA